VRRLARILLATALLVGVYAWSWVQADMPPVPECYVSAQWGGETWDYGEQVCWPEEQE
jgi:hypothetical protein